MAVIKQIESLRLRSKILYDDESVLFVRKKDITENSLKAGMQTDPVRLYAKIRTAQMDEAYESALCSLDYCARTKKEICKKLEMKGYLPEVCEAVCERLCDVRLLNDEDIARSIVEKQKHAGKGRYSIAQKLRSRGIDESMTTEVLEELSDSEQKSICLETAKKLSPKYKALPEREYRSKLSQALARRGFSWDTIEYALEHLSIGEGWT